ncbi:MAG: transglutaminase-like domain-containing protein [Lachnospiraceae bacterium]|nr:transglutaminase-like domain-containing protein [Lachnospiraceae bacterium]
MISALYDILCLLPLSLVPCLWGTLYRYPDAPLPGIMVISLLLSLSGIAMVHLKAAGRILLGGTLLTLLLGSLLLFPEEIRERFSSEYPWCVTAVLLALFAFLAGTVLNRIRIGRILLAAGLLAACGAGMFLRHSPVKPIVVLSFFYALLVLLQEIQVRWKKAGDTEPKKHLVHLAPFLLLTLLLLAVFPAPDHPYDWALAKRIYASASGRIEIIREYFHTLGGRDETDHFMGFSEGAGLNSGAKRNDRAVMEVRITTAASPVLYLTGKTFDAFDGQEWKKTDPADDAYSFPDALETYAAVSAYAGEDLYDLLRLSQVEIRFLALRSAHAFAPAKASLFRAGSYPLSLLSKGDDLYFEKRQKHGYTYTVDYLKLNASHPAFAAYLHNAPGITEEDLLRTAATLRMEDPPTMEALADYHRRIRELYLPETHLTERTQSYLAKLLSGCDTDLERLQTIETMLSSMTYHTAPGQIPDSVTSPERFLDHFLFEMQQGQCVYYASAFVTMARSLGIPARFVQGYRVPMGRGGVATVTENMAHAWPECYLEGAGWIRFEPTPGMAIYSGWKTKAETDAEYAATVPYAPVPSGETDPVLPELTETEEEGANPFPLRSILLLLAITIPVFFLLLALSILIRKIRFRHGDPEWRYRICFRGNLYLLRLLGYRQGEGETLQEFRTRLQEFVPAELLTFLAKTERILYRGDPVTADMIFDISTANRRLIGYVKKQGFRARLQLLRYYLMEGGY